MEQTDNAKNPAGAPSALNVELGVDHLAVLESMIVKKDSVQNRVMRGCCGEIKRSRNEIERLRSAVKVMIAAFCLGDNWVGVYVRDQADAALSYTPTPNVELRGAALLRRPSRT